MQTSALIMMITSSVIVTVMTIYYFAKVLMTPPKDPEHDSYSSTHKKDI